MRHLKPIYSYECPNPKCEFWVSLSEYNLEFKCPRCGQVLELVSSAKEEQKS